VRRVSGEPKVAAAGSNYCEAPLRRVEEHHATAGDDEVIVEAVKATRQVRREICHLPTRAALSEG
jgi:hypothetical protein